jgi:hypothetical protein
VTVLRQRVAVLEAEDQRVRAERDQLAGQVERLEVGNQQLRARIGELAWQVEELRRAGRRQAAPFSKDRSNPSPRRPGRKAGDAYGRRARRPVPDRVDRVVSVPLPAACPSCGGPIAFKRVADQHQAVLDQVDIAFDDQRAVALAGLLLPATLAERLGVEQVTDQVVDLGDRPGAAHPECKLLTLVHALVAGGDCIDDGGAAAPGSHRQRARPPGDGGLHRGDVPALVHFRPRSPA